jgi:purine-nucleoside phosphorylase
LEYSFQIHNDALSLMTVSDMVSTEQQSQCI